MSFRDKWEAYLLGVINKEVGGFTASLLRGIFSILSRVYTVGVSIRVFLYKHNLLRSNKLGCLVISIGNLTVGGTGKTPIVEMFAKALIEGGRKVAILSRGYKVRTNSGKGKPSPFVKELGKPRPDVTSGWGKAVHVPKIVSDSQRVLLDVETSGDEPFMLAKEVPQAVVLVDKNRVRAARFAIERFGIDTIILDDGYQYLPLARQVNIVLIDCTNPFGNQRLLPRGILREPIKNLDRANLFFLTKTKGMDLYALKKRLNRINPKAEVIECAHRPRYLNDVYSGTKRDLGWLLGRRITCVSGIASPQGFEEALTKLGAVLVSSHRFPDHHMYTKIELEEIVRCAQLQKAEALVTTQKDAVRFPKISHPKDFPIYYLRVEIEMLTGSEDFYDRIGKMCY